MRLGSPSTTWKFSTISPGNAFILGSEIKVTVNRSGYLHSCECWLLLVCQVDELCIVEPKAPYTISCTMLSSAEYWQQISKTTVVIFFVCLNYTISKSLEWCDVSFVVSMMINTHSLTVQQSVVIVLSIHTVKTALAPQ